VKLVGRVPVEQLDDERMTNIERRIVAGAAEAAARPAPSRAPWRLLAFAGAAIAAMAAGVIGWKLRGAPDVVEPTAEQRVAISTAATGGTLSIGDATIQSDPGAVYVVTRPEGGVLVELSKGRVELEVAKRDNRPPLVVRAGDTDVIVVGTRFSVDYGDGTGVADVRVTEGVVKVVRHHQEVRVAANQAWEPARGVIAIADAKPVTRVTSAEPDGAAPGARDGATIGEVSTGGSGDYEIDMGTGPDVLHGRTAAVPDGKPPVRTGSDSGASAGSAAKPDLVRPPRGGGAGSGGSSTAPTGGIVSLIKAQPVEPPLDIGEPVAATAVSRYQELIRNKTSGEDESRAYYGIAYMQAMKLGRTGDALRTIMVYERRFSQGRVYPERTAIAWLKLRILCLRALDDECRGAAASYQRLAPDGPSSHIAEKVTLGD